MGGAELFTEQAVKAARALLAPERGLIAVSSLFMVGLLSLLLLMLWKGRLGRLDGAALVLLCGAYLAAVFVL